jgi:hypothetical protein
LRSLEGYGEKLAALEPQAEVAKRVEAKCAEIFRTASELMMLDDGDRVPTMVYNLAEATQDLAAAVAEICKIVRPLDI